VKTYIFGKLNKNGFMKYTTLLFLFLSFFFIRCSNAQEKEPLKLISTSIEMTPFSTGYINAKGDTVIPIGKYVYCYTEVFDKIAVVLPKDRKEFFAIDRNEKELFVVLSTDNGPDYIKDGMFRIKINNKIGFANMQGNIIIKPIYDFALPFENGYAKVNSGGHIKHDIEYQSIEGGKWGLINTKGQYILQPIYDRIYDIHSDKVKVLENGIKKEINIPK